MRKSKNKIKHVILHLPETQEGMAELERAGIQAIEDYVRILIEQKKLVNDLRQEQAPNKGNLSHHQ